LNDNFKISGFARLNNGTGTIENAVPSILQTSASQTGLKASYSTAQYLGNQVNNNWSPNETNYEITAAYNKKLATILVLT